MRPSRFAALLLLSIVSLAVVVCAASQPLDSPIIMPVPESFGQSLIVWLAAVVLFVLPGLALQSFLASSPLSFGQRLGLAAGLGLALYPVLLLWTHLFGMQLGAWYVWLVVGASLAVLIARRHYWLPAARESLCHARDSSSVTLLWVTGLIIVTRTVAVRSLEVPLWGDSYQHTVLAQLLVDHGGLFSSWQPYAELQTLTYHFGFHTAAAAWHWLTGWVLPQSALWTGQVLNALAVIALYPLAVKVAGNRWAGAATILVAGLLSPMPMFYTNWGRYTQLAGQVILPAAILLAWLLLEAERINWGLLAVGWLVWGGLALTHYRVLIFALCFLGAYFALKCRKHNWRALSLRLAALGAGALVLFAPWLVNMFAGRLTNQIGILITTPADAAPVTLQQYNAIGELGAYLPVALWLALLVAIGWGLWRRQMGVTLISLWWLAVWLAANPQWLRLPGVGILTNFAVLIAAYIPASILIGNAFGAVMDAPARHANRWVSIGAVAMLIALGLWGGQERLGDINPSQFALVTPEDLQAANWIRQHTDPESQFLVNTFFAYNNNAIVGGDGGWWLPIIARRRTMLPPLTYTAERGARPDYAAWVNALSREIQQKGVTHPDVLARLAERGITHVYIGEREGRVNYDGPFVLQAEQLLADSHFRAVYHQNRVWVFEILR